MKTIILAIAFVFVYLSVMGQNLTLEVRDIENPQGYLMVGIYNSKETFRQKPVAAFRVEVKNKVMNIPCAGLPTGMYAISMFHDENENGKLDVDAYGRPTEKFGFSNDAERVMGAPSYEKCCFELRKDTTMVIHLK